MHGQHHEDRQQRWRMRPGPLRQRPAQTPHADSSSVKCLSKAGRKVGVGDCALFRAGNAPPFIGIIRKLIEHGEDDVKLSVNWLYRPGDIKLAKGLSLDAAPNEIFYSFHEDEILAASLLHPCKIAFLEKDVELPSGVSSFVCRRVYDTSNKCMYWLTDQDYTDEHQAEVNKLLDRTKREMQLALQTGVALRMSQQQSDGDGVNALVPAGQGKSKKRERPDHSSESNKREKAMKQEDSNTKKTEEMEHIADKDGGLFNTKSVDQLVQSMLQEHSDSVKTSSELVMRRTSLANLIGGTEKEECLAYFVQLGGIRILDDWLQEIHKGKVGDNGCPKDGDKGCEELLLALLQALERLPVDLNVLKTCTVGKSVNNLRSYRNAEIQKKSRKLVETWKRRVDAEMKSSDEQRSNPATNCTCKQPPLTETHDMKGRYSVDCGASKSTSMSKMLNGPSLGDTKCNISVAVVKEEKSCSSSQSQNNSQSCCSGSMKGIGSWKDEAKTPPALSTGTKPSSSLLKNYGNSSKGSILGTTAAASIKETTGGKHRISIDDKVASLTSADKGAHEVVRADNTKSQRLIVRLPNPVRSPTACGIRGGVGGSLNEGGLPSYRATSPGSLKQHNSNEVKGTTPGVRPPDASFETAAQLLDASFDKKDGKGGDSECKEESHVASANDVDRKVPDSGYGPNEIEQKDCCGSADVLIEKKGTTALEADPVGKTSLDTNQVGLKESSLDLPASSVTCVALEVEKYVTGACAEDLPSVGTDIARDLGTQRTGLKESQILIQEKHWKGPEILVNTEGLSECSASTCTEFISSAPVRDDLVGLVKNLPDRTNQSTEKQSLGERCQPGVSEQPPLLSNNSVAEENNSGIDGQNRAKFGGTETLHSDNSSLPPTSLGIVNTLAANDAVKGVKEDTHKVCLVRMPFTEGPKVGASEKGGCTPGKEAEQEAEKHADPVQAMDKTGFIKSELELENTGNDCAKSLQLTREHGDGTVKGFNHDGADDESDGKKDKIEEVVVGGPSCVSGVKVNLAAKNRRPEAEVAIDPLGVVTQNRVPEMEGETCSFSAGISETVQPAIQSAERHTTTGLDLPCKDEKSEADDAPSRPVFDLNEGFTSDDVLHETDVESTTSLLIPSMVSSTQLGSLAAPVAIVAAARGPFLPPSSPLISKGDRGWIGSAATSAFRPAEPRRTAEPAQLAFDIAAGETAEASSQSNKRARVLDIDLNVVDDKALEGNSPATDHPSSDLVDLNNSSFVSGRLALDLNRVDGCEDTMGAMLDTRVSDGAPLTASRVIRDFDLNDGLDSDEAGLEVPSLLNGYVERFGNMSVPALSGPISNLEVAAVPSWYPAANSMSTVMMPAFPAGRLESSFPTGSALNVTPVNSVSHNFGSYNGDLYRSNGLMSTSLPPVSYTSGVAGAPVPYTSSMVSTPITPYSATITSTPAISYSTSMPPAFSFPFGSGFPFTSASYKMGTSSYGSATISPAPSQLVSAGAIMSSYGRSYPVSISEGPGPDSTCVSWSTRPSLDINAGVDVLDKGAREELRHTPGSSQLSFQQAGSSSGQSKRKEPDCNFDPFRSGFKQTTWR